MRRNMIAKFGHPVAGSQGDQKSVLFAAYTSSVAHCTFLGSNLRLLIAVIAMSPNALIPSHRKPRRPSASSRALRAGVTGGFLTLAVTGATVPANAAEKPVSETQEMPTITTALATSAARSADTAEQVAFNYERQALQDSAFSKAAKAAEKDKAEAVKKAKAEAKKKAEEARKAKEAAQARASRSSERSTLSAPSSSATGSTATLVSFLKAQLGKAYVLGSSGPSSYDCSGLTQAAFNQIGIDLPRVSQDQSTAGKQVGLDNLQVGDILYWGSAGSAYHVGVYVGDGKFIGAQNSSTGIVERPLDYDMPTGAVRVL
ncbi:Cell wall-associated hydrolase, NlpC family [Streptomyces sp. KS_16]|nr:cell wall-associated NlpC family hydrolase [Streptomyces sp. 2321.6]SDR44115.1 Cell wall-associated hydrolase, NlpC family [Streptomyces sp. KS_16]SEC88877.1 Cell wall-associated hydrolase, NlpC family [Streptomyces sp. 2133.1]SNC69304.1 Cell wall-associated hydrolase, NlpC family [Streptomyces sp. 2114.4]